MKNKPAICLEVRKRTAKAGYTAIMIMINNEVPSSPAEVAFLMSLMSHMAVLIDDSKGDKVQLDLSHDQAVGVWHSCNVSLNNDLTHNKNDAGDMMELLDLLARRLDGEIEEINFKNGSKIILNPNQPEHEKLRGIYENNTEDKTQLGSEQGSDGGIPDGKQGLSIVGDENPKEL